MRARRDDDDDEQQQQNVSLPTPPPPRALLHLICSALGQTGSHARLSLGGLATPTTVIRRKGPLILILKAVLESQDVERRM